MKIKFKCSTVPNLLAFATACLLTNFSTTTSAQTTTPPTSPGSTKQPADSDAAQAETSEAPKTKTQETADAEAPEPMIIKVAGESIQFTATGAWENVPPQSNMLEAEIKIPKVGNDEQDGRLTIMGAGGSIEANIARWQAQFTQPDGTATPAKTEQKKIADQSVNLVDISGTFLDAPGGPFGGAPKVERANYRMLAAIVETEVHGNYFIKFYGPKATIDKNADEFKAMIESLKVAD